MLIAIPEVLDAAAVRRLRGIIDAAEWVDGNVTSGHQSALAKRNEQLPEASAAAKEAGGMILDALGRTPLFVAAALPAKVFPPLFNRYAGATNTYGAHVDQAVRYLPGGLQRVRTDISCTLFLSDPADYDGGDLVIDTTFGEQRVKLAAGDLVVYPGTSVHRVEPVTRGERLASFFWIESMVRGDEQRRLLYEMDMSLMKLRGELGETPELVQLTGTYHNLLRMWADT